MDIYTIVFQFKGGTYISQLPAEDEREALTTWATTPSDEFLFGVGFNGAKANWIEIITEKLEDLDSQLVPLTGLHSVWYTMFLIKKSGGHINVIRTKI